MRSLVLDELCRADMEKLASYLASTLTASAIEGVYWLDLPPDLLSAEQAAHGDCGPHRVALVLEEESLRLELLVRAHDSLRCTCTGYASLAQRQFLLGYMDRLIAELGLMT